jgi:membrane-associated protease RseP (regulator of RpoE activity)
MEELPQKDPSSSIKPEEKMEVGRFELLRGFVEEEFDVKDALIEFGVPTFYVKFRKNSKQAFLNLLRRLEPEGCIPLLRRTDGRTVLKITSKPKIKPSNPWVNVALFLATILTTFATGYILSLPLTEAGLMQNPFIGAAAFSASILAILGAHEMGHKLAANKHKVKATLPYFIPAPPPILGGIGTFGAVIMQKSLPPNRDALFDIGSFGPVIGFFVTIIVTAMGIMLSYPVETLPKDAGVLPVIPLFTIIFHLLINSGLFTAGKPVLLHPVAFAGWVGMLITMLNLLPAAMLDGGHIIRCLVSEKIQTAFLVFSILFLFFMNLWPMALFVLFMSMAKHPGPLDDVSGLSTRRKIFAVFLVLIFLSCVILFGPLLDLFLWFLRLLF